ncbi:hypothetical protein OG394_27795 [Kribbella sp. NBC_01245]|uniref:hypothetical protein n=1 Tax=Kribbella sp. NBC_01245 TaxID=2903578 RepID=UPI002E2CA89B|nr:hypothetical protein [Kribbella sp. NBC_01245]
MSRARVRPMTLAEVWIERLGVEGIPGLGTDLEARFTALFASVTTDIPEAGSAHAAVAYSDLRELAGFLADARLVLLGKENHS